MNLSPLRQPDPNKLDGDISADARCDEPVELKANLSHFKQLIDAPEVNFKHGLIAKRGGVIKRGYLKTTAASMIEELLVREIATYCVDISKAGHPYHCVQRRIKTLNNRIENLKLYHFPAMGYKELFLEPLKLL